MLHDLFKRLGDLVYGAAPAAPTALEPLEQRAMLAGDLAITVGTPTLQFTPSIQNDRIQVPITITNIGDRVIKSPFRVILSLSTDATVGNDYSYTETTIERWVRAGEVLTPNLLAAMPFDLVGRLGNPALAQGNYRIRAQIAYLNGASDENAANNNVFSASTVPLSYTFGGDTRGNRRRTVTAFVDNFQQLKFEINGPGTGTASISNGVVSLSLTGTTTSSSLWIKPSTTLVAANLGAITVTGSLKELRAPSISMNGNLSVSGDLRRVTLGSINNSAWTIGGTQSTSGTITSVVNTSLDSRGSIGTLTVGSWTTSDSGSDAVIATGVKSFKVNGTFSPDMRISGSVETASIAGTVSGRWDVGTKVTSFDADATTDNFALNASTEISRVTLRGDLLGSISSRTIGTVTIEGAMTGAAILAGSDLGSDTQVGGTGDAADTFSAGLLTSVFVRRGATSSLVACSLNPVDSQFINSDDRFASADSRINSIRILGATFATNFAAKTFGRSMELTKVRVNPATDARFRSDFPVSG